VAFSGAQSVEAIQLTSEAMSPVWHEVGLPAPTYADICGDIIFHPFPPSLGQVPNARRVEMMRPELVSAVDDGVPTWLDGFGRDRPGVYVTAGTTVRAASSQAPWTQILEALASLDIDVIATMGPSVDIARLTHPPPNVRVARYVPQRHLLDRVAVVVSHGGAGTMLGAALHGRPQLVIPTFADQWDNADAIVGSGAAILSEPEDRNAEGIAVAVGRLLSEPSFGIAARRVADEIAVMPTAADHVSTIVALVGTTT
jgi:UDP:flavonoid glycosyltransferase YjiC (YdhE family)